MRRSPPPASLALSVLALLAGCAGEGAGSPAPASADGLEPPGFCHRAHDDVSDLFCGERGAHISALADLRRELGLDRTSMLGHSTALSGRLVSPINPRAILIRSDDFDRGYTAAAFTRGEQAVELISLDRETDRFNLYLVSFEQACNDEPDGCSPGDRFTPAIERDWRTLRIRDDEELKNTPQDCRRCHGGAPDQGGKPMLLMREIDGPWLHWFSQFSPLNELYAEAKGDEPYAGAVEHFEQPSTFEGQVRIAEAMLGQPEQPLHFVSGVIGLETTEIQAMIPLTDHGDVPSPTWQLLYDAYRAGLSPAPPYHHASAADPDKLAAMSAAYRAYLDGDLERDELPDISDVLPDDVHQLAEASFAVDPEAEGEDLLIQACGDCHNASLDQSVSRARFDIDLSRVTRETLALASARIDRGEDDPSAMPPPGARTMSAAQRRALSAYLSEIDPNDVTPRPGRQQTFDTYALELGYMYQTSELPSDAVEIGDLSGDGRADLICAPWIFEQKDDHGFGDPATLDAAPLSEIELVDLDGDGKLDIVSRGEGALETAGLVAFMAGDDGFGAGVASAGPFAEDLARSNFADVDRDGHLDLVTRVDRESSALTLYRGDGQGAFTAAPLALDVGAEARWAALALGDVDADGVADLVLLQLRPAHEAVVFLHDGEGGFLPDAGRYSLPLSVAADSHISIGDANGDGLSDIALSPGIRLLLQGEDGRFGAGAVIHVNSGPAKFFDMNADGAEDLVALATDRGEVHVLLQGELGLSRPATIATLKLPSSTGSVIDMLEIADLNEDGCPDVAIARMGSIIVVHGSGCAR